MRRTSAFRGASHYMVHIKLNHVINPFINMSKLTMLLETTCRFTPNSQDDLSDGLISWAVTPPLTVSSFSEEDIPAHVHGRLNSCIRTAS